LFYKEKGDFIMDDTPNICPDLWPKIIWDLHFGLPHVHGGPGNPVNYPPYMNAIFAGLAIHTASYLLLDQAEAQKIRTQTETQLSEAIRNLSQAHNDAMAQRQEPK
jgi:hypothetical protein